MDPFLIHLVPLVKSYKHRKKKQTHGGGGWRREKEIKEWKQKWWFFFSFHRKYRQITWDRILLNQFLEAVMYPWTCPACFWTPNITALGTRQIQQASWSETASCSLSNSCSTTYYLLQWISRRLRGNPHLYQSCQIHAVPSPAAHRCPSAARGAFGSSLLTTCTFWQTDTRTR